MGDEVVNPVETTKPNLTSVIEDAALKVAKEVGLEIQEDEKASTSKEEKNEAKAKSEVKDSKDSKETSETKTTEEKKEDLNEEQLVFAKNLFKALSNPDSKIQVQTIKLLANAAGIELKDVETKKEQVEAKKAFIDLLKAGLGEYDFLADKIAPAIEQAIKEAVDAGTKEVKDKFANQERERELNEISIGVDKAFATYSNSAELKSEVEKLVDEFKPTGKMSHEAYFKSLLLIAAERKGVTLLKVGETKKEESKNLNKNRNDAAARLESDRGAEVKLGVRTPGKMNLNDAVNAAIESLGKEK